MWPGIISWQEARLAPRENDRAGGARKSKSTHTAQHLRQDHIHICPHKKDKGDTRAKIYFKDTIYFKVIGVFFLFYVGEC